MQVARGGKRGKTAGRGGKGQTARAGNKRRPEWRDIIKKLPKLRGRGVNSNKTVKTGAQKPQVINLSEIEVNFKAGESVTPTILVEKGVISTASGKIPRVKILGDGEITIALKFSGCFISESAKAAVIKVGGTVELPKVTINTNQADKVRDPARMKEEAGKASTAKETKKNEPKPKKKVEQKSVNAEKVAK